MIPGDIPLPIVLAWLFVIGSIVGSFLNVCIYRIPQHDSLWQQLRGLNHPPSSCPWCKKRILATDNIPIFGWLRLRGRCRFCRHSIPIRYALIELFNGLLWVVLYVAIVPAGYSAKIQTSTLFTSLGALGQPHLSPSALVWLVNAQYLYYLILAEALLVATFIDFDLMIIPEAVTTPATIAGVIGAFILGAPSLWPAWFFSRQELSGIEPVLPNWLHWMLQLPEQLPWLIAHPHWHGLISSVLGLLVGGGTVWVVRIVGNWVFQREAMGDGDIYLMAMIGSFLGWQPSLVVFFLVAPLCALLATAATFTLQFSRPIPFGPYLSAGALLVVLFWNPWFSKFETFFSRGPLLPVVFLLMSMMFVPLLLFVRFIKYRLGFRDVDDPEEFGDWTSGDQLTFYANKEERAVRTTLDSPIWPGIPAGQGTLHADRWRGTRSSGYP